MARVRNIVISLLLILPAPHLLMAGEGVDVSFSVQSLSIQDRIAANLSSKAEWSLAAEDVGTGKSMIDRTEAENAYFLPGSIMKLFTTAALLEQDSGSAVDLATQIAVNGRVSNGKLHGDVIIKGVGNSLLTTRDLLGAVEKVKALGIRNVSGDVIVDDSFFNVQGWNNRYSGPAYGVPCALGLDLHTVSVGIEGKRIVIDPPNDNVRVSLNPSGKTGIRRIDDLTYEITGAKQDAFFHNRFSLQDPALYAGGTFITLLKKQGVAVSGTVKRGFMPSEAREIVRIGSSDVREFIRDTNRQSLNVAADNMLFLLGAVASGTPGTREKGIRAVHAFLRKSGVPLKGLVIDDGSGVSKRNRVSTEQMVEFLRLAAKKPWFDAFYESLSRPGMDGRLREFGYRSDHIRMKSGQLPDAYGLAGYVDRPDGKKIAFAYLVNGLGPDISQGAPAAAVDVLRILEDNL